MKYLSIILLISFFIRPSQGQSLSVQKFHAFSGTLVLSGEGGFTLGQTDYKSSDPGGRLIGGIEYYLPSYSPHIFGIRGFAGGQVVYSNDKNKTVVLPNTGSTILPDKIEAEMYITGLGLVYAYSINNEFFPYLSAGVSSIWFSPKVNGIRAPRNSKNEYTRRIISYDTEIGFRYSITNNFSIKLGCGFYVPDTDFLDDVKTGKSKDFIITGLIGISYSFFSDRDSDGDGIPDSKDMCPNTIHGIKVDEFGCPKDTDNDGVPDYLDRCPNTPRGAIVDKDGCPVDSDDDGVPDYLDKCPGTPKDIDVDEYGCPIDSDGDGVPDYLDKCPDTLPGINVNDAGCPDTDNDGVFDNEDRCPEQSGSKWNYGCPDDNKAGLSSQPREIVIECEITFLPGKTDILPDAIPELNRIVKLLQLYPSSNWRIEGHTDRHDKENLLVRPLSLRRAEAILNYFVSKGLPSYQFKVYDMGDDFPIVSNATEYGRMKNRRIVLIREK